jgi:hypothetical protein
MTVYVMRDGQLVERSLATPKYSGSDATYVISDEMSETRHMADGKYYTSKHKFREATRAAGCYEYGNELPTLLKPRKPIELSREKRRDDIRRTIYELKNGIRRD